MLIFPISTESYVKREAGGKGYNIYFLTKNGFPVPKWVIIPAKLWESFIEFNGLELKIKRLLTNLKNNDRQGNVSLISKTIKEMIFNSPFDPFTLKELKQAYSHFKAKPLAVRSSGLEEDSPKYSFAGQFDSFLFIKSQSDAFLAVKKCWASAFSDRSFVYRMKNQLSLEPKKMKMSVIFQEMVDAEKSGVIFTSNPVDGEDTKMVINSVYGTGEELVSGQLEGETFIVDKRSLGKEIPQEPKHRRGAVLNGQEIKSLGKLALSIENIYRYPQDIEWAMKNGNIYILQTRPITTPLHSGLGSLNIWDNSNIIESYGGITLPLTFTFARYVYHQVYVQFCELLMVPEKEIKNMDYFLKNMLGLFHGRVYYNLLNWYKLTSILPGYKYNRSFMETMMGTNKSLEADIAERIKPPVSQSRFIKILTGFKFLFNHFVIQQRVNNFLNYFNKVYQEYRKIDYSKMTSEQILSLYPDIERRLLRQWHAPIINDYLCMVHFGILKKLTQKWLGRLGETLQNDLLCGEGNLESTEPTKELIRLSQLARRSNPLKQLLLNTTDDDCIEALNQSPYKEFKKRIDRYIDLYGYRCMNEMKLEEKDLYQDQSFLFACLKNYLKNKNLDVARIEKREKEIRQSAEKKVLENLTGIKRSVYFWSLKNTRKALRNRENTRFCRTRIYGVVRSWFYNIGRDYTTRSIIDKPEDIFYLEIEEVLGSVEGTLTIENLKPLIELRKQEYKRYESLKLPNRFMTYGPVYWMNEQEAKSQDVTDKKESNGLLKGVGCSPGVIRGKVKVVLSSKDNIDLKGEILVTTRTDPGWIPLYPMISGLLVERGSLLSHSAVVAREMGIPTIVGVEGLTKRLKDGVKIKMDGKSGLIEVLA